MLYASIVLKTNLIQRSICEENCKEENQVIEMKDWNFNEENYDDVFNYIALMYILLKFLCSTD